MATIMTKRGQLDNVVTYEHICDTVADMANINPSYVTLGSVCIVIKGENDDLEVYMADSTKEWKIISSSSGEGSISSSGIHICAQDEYDSVTGMPTIEDPLSNTFYLTPGGDETNDLYNEWIWLEDDEEWEKFGSATTAISQSDWNQLDSSADDFIKNKPAISQQANGGGILENMALNASGACSHAEGSGTAASGYVSHAEGSNTDASGSYSHAEGGGTTASGLASHAEGSGTKAIGDYSHTEGGGTEASGVNSHAEGAGTKAIAGGAHAEGQGTTARGSSSHAEGNSTTASGDGSHSEGGGTTASGSHSHAEGGGTTASGHYSHAEGSNTTASGYYSHSGGLYTTANHMAQHVFGIYNIPDNSNASTGEKGNYVEIVGNGLDTNTRSNARTLDWEGNQEVAGDIIAYGCGGANPISLSDLKDQVDQAVSDVQVNGVSVVSNGVANVPIASTENLGVIGLKAISSSGVALDGNGKLVTQAANNTQLKGGANSYNPIVPSNQHSATFYGLAKAAGDSTQSASSNAVGAYTPEAKAAIKDMLGITEGMNIITVSGTAPTINAANNTQYLCGEVLSLNFTPSSTGICDVIFTSGSTQTVLTIPATVKMPEWFEVEANKIYEISITNGVYGAVMVWENA